MSSVALKEIFTAARPLVEQWLDVGEQIAALREVATAKGLDWSQVKALLKAQIQDERDEGSDGKRVRRIVEKAEFASAYADMLGLANVNEKKYSRDAADDLPAHDSETGELIESERTERPSTNDEPSQGAGPQAEAPLAGIGSWTPAGREGRPEGEAASADLPTHSHPDEASSSQPAAGQADDAALLPASSVVIPEPFEPPAFLRKTAADYRPHCRDPKNCASGSIHKHCHGCQKLIDAEARETEAA